MELRSAAEVGLDFPYTDKTTCIIEVARDGTVSQGGGAAAYRRARDGESRLFAVWPGTWRSDLFEIDDLGEYAKALGLVNDKDRTGLADHRHDVTWTISPHEPNPTGQWVTVNFQFGCGCRLVNLRAFAEAMRAQRGWVVATTSGWGGAMRADGGGEDWSVTVRRRSLD